MFSYYHGSFCRDIAKTLALVLTVFVSAAGCSTTVITDMFSADTNEHSAEDQVLENPFMEEQHALPKPNKSEIELADAAVTDAMSMQQLPLMFERSRDENTVAVMPVPRSSYRPAYTHKALSDYAEQMTMNLLQKTRDISPDSRIAVASFVDFSSDLQTTSVLGNRLSESFISEMQSYGLSIVDFKVMKDIKVTAGGDLFFDRSGPRGDMQYVLTGTMHRNERGVEVNARIVNIHDQVVVASTKGFIPHFIVSSLSPEYMLMDVR